MSEILVPVNFIKQLKQRILQSRYIVAKIANAESLQLYFYIGKDIDAEYKKKAWGAKVLQTVSARLQQELPGLRGFSGESLKKMRRFYNEWKNSEVIKSLSTTESGEAGLVIWSLPTTELNKTENSLIYFLSTPFTHHYEIILKTKDESARWFYIKNTVKQVWTVSHLRIELQNKSHLQTQKIPNNFERTMPEKLSNKAIRMFKDQYLLDFINVEDADDEPDERVLEHEIVANIKKFLMALGNEFAFMGNQYRLQVSENEYFLDLLFFHRSLQSLVAFELKKGKFKPEYVGKMNFYLSALDETVKQPHENPSIGIILCKEKDNKTVEFSFKDVNKPMGVSVYKTTNTLPPELQNVLPDAETLKKLMG